jgi:hypothetical protein
MVPEEEAAQEEGAERRALEALYRWAGGFEWRPASSASEDIGADLIGAEQGRDAFGVVIKALSGSNRVDNLKGAAAMAILALQRGCPELGKLVWLEVDRIGAQAVSKLAEYLAAVAPEVGWAVVDLHGGARISVPTLGLDLSVESDLPAPSNKAPTPLFSDLNGWMLKILLMQRAPEWAWTATREPARNPHALHSVADVSIASAHRFAKAMRDADHLRRDRKGLQLVRVEALLNRWRASHQSQPPALIEARPLFGLEAHSIGLSVLGGRVALGGRIAAEHFGLQHATRGRPTIWVEAELDAALEALDLVRAEPGRGQIWVGRPRHVESCFRGRVIADGVAYVDPCELMLECATDPARGFEQSQYILQRIVAWHEGDHAGAR